MFRILLLIYLILPYCSFSQVKKRSTQQLSKTDSAMITMQVISEKSDLQRMRDSIRINILNEELNQLKRSSSAANNLRKEIESIKSKDSLRRYQQLLLVDSLRSVTTGSPIVLLQDTLFYFFSPIGPFSAPERAQNASKEIDNLYKQLFFQVDSLYTLNQHNFVHIYYGDHIITSLSELDGIWANLPLDSLAENYKTVISKKVSQNRQLYSRQNNIKRIGQAFLVIIVAILIYIVQAYIVRRLKKDVTNTRHLFPSGIKIGNYQFLTNEQVWRYLIRILKFTHGLGLLVFAYITMTILFAIFPTTKTWTGTITQWLWAPLTRIAHQIYEYLPNLFTIIVILLIARYISKLVRYFSLEIERDILQIKGFYKEWARPTYQIFRFLWYSFTFILIFPYLPGSDSTAFKGVSVFLGVIFSIGSSSAIANTVAGFVITYMRPFRVGDWIKIGENTGVVVEKTFLVTRLRTINNEDVTVPNSAILVGQTINYSSSAADKGLILTAQAGFAFTVPWQEIHSLLIKAAKMTPGIDTSREPFVFQKMLGDYYVTYQINAYTHEPNRMYHIQSDLYQNMQIVFKAANIDMKVVQPLDVYQSPPTVAGTL